MLWKYSKYKIKHKEADKNHFQFELKIIVKLDDGIVINGDQLQVLTFKTLYLKIWGHKSKSVRRSHAIGGYG